MVRQISGARQIGLFVFDADANVRRDLNCYSDRFADRCWIVIDDYLGGADRAESCAHKWTSWSVPGDWSHWAFTVSERGSVVG